MFFAVCARKKHPHLLCLILHGWIFNYAEQFHCAEQAPHCLTITMASKAIMNFFSSILIFVCKKAPNGLRYLLAGGTWRMSL